MKTKLSRLALILTGAYGALGSNFAWADDSSVTFYGVIDVVAGRVGHQAGTSGVAPGTVNGFTANTAPNAVNGLFNGGMQGSRWGVKGKEDLGGGLSAFFTLEDGFSAVSGSIVNSGAAVAANSGSKTPVNNITGGSMNGQLFNRQAFVGLSDRNLGSLAFGRTYNPIYDVLTKYDPAQFSNTFSPIGHSGTWGGGGGVSENSRLDNSIRYTNQIDNFNFGYTHKFGGQAGNFSAQTFDAVSLGYEAGDFGVQAVAETGRDAIVTSPNTAATAVGTVTATVSNVQAFLLVGRYKPTAELTLKAGVQAYTLKPPSDTYAVATLPSADGQTVSSVASTYANQTTRLAWLGGDYFITPALNLAIGLYDIHSNSYASSATKTTAAGDQYVASLVLDYNLSKRSDVYAGLSSSSYTGQKFSNANDNATNYVVGVGIRHKF